MNNPNLITLTIFCFLFGWALSLVRCWTLLKRWASKIYPYLQNCTPFGETTHISTKWTHSASGFCGIFSQLLTVCSEFRLEFFFLFIFNMLDHKFDHDLEDFTYDLEAGCELINKNPYWHISPQNPCC